MWTHGYPFIESSLSKKSISRYARIGIYRAINARRLVVMAVSGLGAAHDLPDWPEFAALFVAATRNQVEYTKAAHGEEAVEKCSDQICQLRLILDIPNREVLYLSKERASELQAHLLNIMELCEDILQKLPNDKQHGKSAQWWARRDIAYHFRSKKSILVASKLEELFINNSTKALPFENLCNTIPTKRDDPSQVTIEDGLNKSALSGTLNAKNIGELVSFAAFSCRYDTQIFHLHGRIDDPQNMVVTQKDYNRVYFGSEIAEASFREAQEMMFSGNDILFLGIGLSEEDVMRPFRRFVSRGVTPDQVPKNLFAIIASDSSKDYEAKNMLKAVHNFVNYGIYTYFYGGKDFRKALKILGDIETRLKDLDDIETCLEAVNDIEAKLINESEKKINKRHM